MRPAFLRETGHRPWPLPPGNWIMGQTWSDLLFAHWTADPETLRPHLPAGLELDLFEGEAWVGVVPFRMEDVRLRGLPPVPGTATFPELNVRTYVRHGDRPGVWFFSLDASNLLAVRVARAWFRLPYFDARMSIEPEGDGVRYRSRRTHRGAAPAGFDASYRPTGPEKPTAPGTLEHFLTERYCLYADGGRRGLRRGEIHHRAWPLQPAEAEIRTETQARAAGIALHDRAPLLHFARRIEVAAWSPVPA